MVVDLLLLHTQNDKTNKKKISLKKKDSSNFGYHNTEMQGRIQHFFTEKGELFGRTGKEFRGGGVLQTFSIWSPN